MFRSLVFKPHCNGKSILTYGAKSLMQIQYCHVLLNLDGSKKKIFGDNFGQSSQKQAKGVSLNVHVNDNALAGANVSKQGWIAHNYVCVVVIAMMNLYNMQESRRKTNITDSMKNCYCLRCNCTKILDLLFKLIRNR